MAQGTLEGELSFAQVPRQLRLAESLVAGGSLDLSQVTRADSAGLALLLELTRRSRGSLTIRGANEQVRQLAGFFGLDKILHFE